MSSKESLFGRNKYRIEDGYDDDSGQNKHQ